MTLAREKGGTTQQGKEVPEGQGDDLRHTLTPYHARSGSGQRVSTEYGVLHYTTLLLLLLLRPPRALELELEVPKELKLAIVETDPPTASACLPGLRRCPSPQAQAHGQCSGTPSI